MSYSIEEMSRQTSSLAADYDPLLRAATRTAGTALDKLPGPIERVVLIGSGDSYHAALAVRAAFADQAGFGCVVTGAQEFLDSGSSHRSTRTLLVGISASGGNPAVVEAITRGESSVAVTGSADSALARAARHTVHVPLAGLAPCPGIRTYQASLVGLLALAAGLAARAGRAATELSELRDTDRLAAAIDRAASLAREQQPKLVAELRAAPLVLVTGSGPRLGTAMHVAAKLVEAAGQAAIGVDLDQWWHVQRFAIGVGRPILLIGTPGRGRDAALAIARRTIAADRRVVAVVGEHDDEFRDSVSCAVPVAGPDAEPLRPLVDHVFAGVLAAGLAQDRGRLPFAPL